MQLEPSIVAVTLVVERENGYLVTKARYKIWQGQMEIAEINILPWTNSA